MTPEERDSLYRSPLTPFQERMMFLDIALTGARDKDADHNARSTRFAIDDFFAGGDPVYYLSDGGYSRVGCSEETGRLHLTSNSTDRVRSQWAGCSGIIDDIEQDVKAWMRLNGWSEP